jgi:hypothetical protein
MSGEKWTEQKKLQKMQITVGIKELHGQESFSN